MKNANAVTLSILFALAISFLPGARAAVAPVTADSLPGEMAKARQKLQTMPMPPADISAATMEKLRSKSIGVNLRDDDLALWEVAARPNDFVKVGAIGYRAAELATRGRIRLQPPESGAKTRAPSPKLMEKAWGLTLSEKATPEEQIKMADAAHAAGKKFTAAPTGERLLEWGDAKVGELARHVDLIVIQAERWMYEDHSPAKQEYVNNVLRFSRAIRGANPHCEIFVELGRRLDRGGGAADEVLRALALLCEKDSGSFDGFEPFITRQDTNDPKQGIGALYHLLAWLRPEALVESPGTKPAGEGWKPLFNGKDLSGWKIPAGDNGHWKVVDGVVDYDALSEAPGDKHLWTESSFGDFTVTIDWRIKETMGLYKMKVILPDGSEKKDDAGHPIILMRPNADSGIFPRGSNKAQINIWCWPIGSGEVWGYRRDETQPAAVRAACVPKVCADKPVGEWNTFVITVQGNKMTVDLNGKNVINKAELAGLPASGPIGLQHHGGKKNGEWVPASSLMQFRNIYVRESTNPTTRNSP